VALFKELGFEGCSSHSGRRSFITVAARNIHRSGCSLRDVQLLARHRSIETTERYIDGDSESWSVTFKAPVIARANRRARVRNPAWQVARETTGES
jgi:integrase